ncbi:unnamed protein product [Peniophora sp. CBMAI 1063]|nr:unnamed protein product [Peniophora sp. CBMAI 1063]
MHPRNHCTHPDPAQCERPGLQEATGIPDLALSDQRCHQVLLLALQRLAPGAMSNASVHRVWSIRGAIHLLSHGLTPGPPRPALQAALSPHTTSPQPLTEDVSKGGITPNSIGSGYPLSRPPLGERDWLSRSRNGFDLECPLSPLATKVQPARLTDDPSRLWRQDECWRVFPMCARMINMGI